MSPPLTKRHCKLKIEITWKRKKKEAKSMNAGIDLFKIERIIIATFFFVLNKVYNKKIVFFILKSMSKITLNLDSSKKSSKKIGIN